MTAGASAVSDSHRPSRAHARPRFLRVAAYHATLYSRFWRGSIVTIFVSPFLYLLAMGLGVGSLIDDNPSAALGGRPYLHYVAPGLMAAAAMQTAVGGSLYPVLASVKWLRTAYGVTATPIRPVDMAAGLQTWLAIQIFVAATVFTAIMGVAGAISSAWVVAAPFAAVLGGLAYSAPAAAWAVGRDGDHSFALIFRLGVLPSFLLSGTFFPIGQLPIPVRWLAGATPLWHSVELIRGFATGRFAWGITLVHVAVNVAYATVGLLFGRREYTTRLHQ